MHDLTEIGYLAGLLDAEGSISLKRSKRQNASSETYTYEPIITMGMKYNKILERFVSRYSGSVRYSKNEKIYRYARSGSMGVKDILIELAPYLIEKKDRAKLLLEYINSVSKKVNRLSNGVIIPYSADEMKLRESFYLKMKELNKTRVFPFTTDTQFDSEAVLIGYLAGIVDGEGCFRISKINPSEQNNRKSTGYTARFCIGMRDKRILNLFKERYGGSLIEEKRRGKPSGLYRYNIVGNVKIVPLISETIPFLIEKRERANLVIEYINNIDSRRNVDENGTFIPMSDKQLHLREYYFLKLKELNKSKDEIDNRFYEDAINESIINLYTERKLSPKEIADLYQCDQQKIYNTIKFNKVNIQHTKNKPKLGKYNFEEALEWDKLHNHENISLGTIAYQYFNDRNKYSIVSECLKRFGFNVRSEDKSVLKWTKETAEDWYKIYTNERLSIKEIGESIGIDPSIIRKVLKRNGYNYN